LINNAGYYNPDAPRALTADGFEMHMGTNHIGHFLFTHLLLERLVRSAPARVVTLSSGLHAGGMGMQPARIDFDDLHMERGYKGLRAYSTSKLANVLFTYELQRRTQRRGVTANAVSPQMVPATVARHTKGIGRFMMKYVMPLLPMARTAEEAAQNTVYAATDPALEGKGGLYVEDLAPKRSSEPSYDTAVAARLWEVTLGLCGLSAAA
jgi:NAD(P)-dependent dehydrogenase (short-subunit alcohol dehydrogenase family)